VGDKDGEDKTASLTWECSHGIFRFRLRAWAAAALAWAESEHSWARPEHSLSKPEHVLTSYITIRMGSVGLP
jgi:hypothetical protein